MIPPSLLCADLFFYAVPVWAWEAVPAPSGDTPEQAPNALEAAATAAACQLGEPEPAAAAATAALRLVFKGYEWRSGVDWSCMALPEWDAWSDSKRDESSASARALERARRGVAPQPVPAAPGPQAGPGVPGAADPVRP